jgi:hypothetical protein
LFFLIEPVELDRPDMENTNHRAELAKKYFRSKLDSPGNLKTITFDGSKVMKSKKRMGPQAHPLYDIPSIYAFLVGATCGTYGLQRK